MKNLFNLFSSQNQNSELNEIEFIKDNIGHCCLNKEQIDILYKKDLLRSTLNSLSELLIHLMILRPFIKC